MSRPTSRRATGSPSPGSSTGTSSTSDEPAADATETTWIPTREVGQEDADVIPTNGRGIGVTEALHGAAEWPVIVLFGLITQLGDGWFLFLLGGILYVTGDELPRWGIDRRRGLFVLALALASAALVGILKPFFDLPRPPTAGGPELLLLPPLLEPVFGNVTTAEGSGFPSGHALGSTMVWGGLALVLQWGSFGKRALVSAVVVLFVSLSRLVLGVHYVVDIVVGIGIGLLVLGVLYRFTERGTDPGPVLVAVVGVGVLGLLMGVTFESVAAIGGAVGAWLVWRGVAATTPAHPASRQEVIVGFLVFGAAASLFAVITALEPAHLFTFVGTAVAAGGAVGAPLLGDRFG